MTHRTVWRRPHNSTNVLVPDAGHSVSVEQNVCCWYVRTFNTMLTCLQVLQEKPDALGECLCLSPLIATAVPTYNGASVTALHIAAFLRTQRRRHEETYIGSDAVQALVPYLMSMAKL